jgi:Glycogen recognition site of AMP-activated protein kinase
MTGRNHELERYLAGDIPIERLPEQSRTEEERLQQLLGTLREDVKAPAGFRDSVMRAVEALPPAGWRRLVDWWIRPQPIRVPPLAAALVAAAIAAAALWPATGPSHQSATPAVTSTGVPIRFVLVEPQAASVRLTGDFVSWSRDGIELRDPRGTGVWTADVVLPPGVYQYTFVVNGTDWVPDPRAVSQVDDGFGQVNSVVIVSSEGAA